MKHSELRLRPLCLCLDDAKLRRRRNLGNISWYPILRCALYHPVPCITHLTFRVYTSRWIHRAFRHLRLGPHQPTQGQHPPYVDSRDILHPFFFLHDSGSHKNG